MRGFLIALCLCAGTARATDYFVATNGNDAASGLAPTSAWASIGLAINQAAAGDRILIRGGEYRGFISITNNSGQLTNYIHVLAYSNETPVLKGSRVVETWEPYSTNLWVVTNWTVNSQQVFVEGALMQQLGWPNAYMMDRACSCSDYLYIPHGFSCAQINPTTQFLDIGNPLTNMPAGSFYFDATAQCLYLRLPGDATPAGRLIEASVDVGILYDNSASGCFRISGLSFRHASTFTSTLAGWPGVQVGPRDILEDCTVQWCDGSGVAMRSNASILRCNVSHNGVLGIIGNSVTGVLVQGCTVVSNNYREFAATDTGSIRFIPNSGAIVEGNVVANNRCTGIWFDTCHAGPKIVVRNNVVRDCILPPRRPGDASTPTCRGIYIEFSKNADVYNNLVISNANVGIHLSASESTRVFHNVVTGTRGSPGGHRGLAALAMTNPQSGYPVSSNQFFNNLVFDNGCDVDLMASPTYGDLVFANEFRNNLYYRTIGGGIIMPTSRVVFSTTGAYFDSLTNWMAASGYDQGSLSAPPLLTTNFHPMIGSPAVDAGRRHPAIPLDFEGRPRHVDGGSDGYGLPDIGAFEYLEGTGKVLHVSLSSTNPVPPFASSATAATNLNDALALAQDGDVVAVGAGTYPLLAEVVVTRRITVQSMAGAEATILDGQSAVRCVDLQAEDSFLNGFTLRNGTAAQGGGLRVGAGAVAQSCIVEDAQATDGGGAYVLGGGRLESVHLRRNQATARGGGAVLEAGSLAVNCRIESNSAVNAGSGLWLGDGARIEMSTVLGNSSATANGGGLWLAGSASVYRCSVQANVAASAGGLWMEGAGEMLEGDLTGNRADTGGGAVLMGGGRLNRCMIALNTAQAGSGGGVRLVDGQLINCVVRANTASARGGGVVLDGPGLLDFCTLQANRALWGGGLAANQPGGLVQNTILSGNAGTNGVNWDANAPFTARYVCAQPVLDGTGNFTNDPTFFVPASGDLRLVSGSPCIDAADPYSSVTNDLPARGRGVDGNADGLNRSDLGAYENRGHHYVNRLSTNPVAPYLALTNAARTIQEAINVSEINDVVLVAPGVYTNTASQLTIGRWVTVKSVAGAATTIIDGLKARRGMYLTHPQAVVDGFTFRNGRGDSGGAIYLERGILRNSIIRDNIAYGDYGGVFYYFPIPPRYTCRYYSELYLHEGGGGVTLVSSASRMENCVVFSNSAPYGAGVLNVNGGTIVNCTITRNQGYGAWTRHGGSYLNSILHGNSDSNLVVGGTGTVFRSILSTPLPPGSYALEASPIFVQPDTDDYRLADASPGIDAGLASDATARDANGVPRPLDGDHNGVALPDLGAYEYAHPLSDGDTDGLYDADELIRGTSPLVSDTDADGIGDGHEVTAGTNPLDDASYLHMKSAGPGEQAEGLLIQWASETNRIYTLWRSTNLMTGFQAMATGLIATPPINLHTDAEPAAASFYQVDVRP